MLRQRKPYIHRTLHAIVLFLHHHIHIKYPDDAWNKSIHIEIEIITPWETTF